MNRTALFVALISAALGLLILFQYQQRYEREASGGAPIPVLVAVQDIAAGEPLTNEKLGRRNIPEAYLEDRHIRFSDLNRVIGVRVAAAVRANQSVLWTDLATSSEARRELSALVRPGMRAVTIRANATASFGGLIRPGDRVDVLVTMARSNLEAERVTLPLLQNVLVLAADTDTGGEAQQARAQATGHTATQGRNPENMQVTLSASLNEAQLLVFAGDRGNLSLVLRNPEDIAVEQNPPEVNMNDVIAARGRVHAQPSTPAAANNRIERIPNGSGPAGGF